MFDREFVKQSAELGSDAVMAEVPGPKTASRYIDNEHAGQFNEISPEAMRAHARTNDVNGLRYLVEYRGGVGRMSLVVATTWGPQDHEFDRDGSQTAASRNAVRRRPW
jgi:hypothetical protein